MICVAPSHKLLQSTNDDTIDRVEYQIGSVDRTLNEVTGRFKNK